ncbi:hypothetical protein [Truepera radiovictrix]|uniref:Uncharacterized protein n=1 Tax=Truepera radiovictrix (strain DSM 17093 / CIP 108686 / LMG 22925 / RQ-24) TaxID=649638 RepID=D7CV40_TRURR|nr:hypothetical protein [Truepera radiovictrix]ADI15867.1 conserved hypothetical protein [Truepera radiovictrix DSM 17093]WMT58507.1 hypothetical protein RCV51_06065 [Truepera radiovictrix]
MDTDYKRDDVDTEQDAEHDEILGEEDMELFEEELDELRELDELDDDPTEGEL